MLLFLGSNLWRHSIEQMVSSHRLLLWSYPLSWPSLALFDARGLPIESNILHLEPKEHTTWKLPLWNLGLFHWIVKQPLGAILFLPWKNLNQKLIWYEANAIDNYFKTSYFEQYFRTSVPLENLLCMLRRNFSLFFCWIHGLYL